MKKSTLRILAIAMLVLVMVPVLASCGKTLSGTYTTSDSTLLGGSYEFNGNKYTHKTTVLGLVSTETGKYEIKDTTILFTKDGATSATEFTFSQDKDAGTITIGNITFTKAK